MYIKPDCKSCLYCDTAVINAQEGFSLSWCACQSSPNAMRDIVSISPCDFFIPYYLYDYLVEEAIACNSPEDML